MPKTKAKARTVTAKRKYLIVTYDVTGLSKSAIAALRMEAEVQAEETDATVGDPDYHPNVRVTSKLG